MAELALTSTARSVIRFGVFEAHLRSCELFKDGRRIKLEGQPFQILALLLEHPGELVTREELQNALWPADTFVDFETSINAAVRRLRDALGDSAESPRFIQTLPRRGYRFIGSVDPVEPHVSRAPAMAAPPTAGSRRAPWRLALRLSMLATTAGALLAAAYVPALRDVLFGPTVTALAFLPLTTSSDDPAERQFAEGLNEELITELGRLDSLQIRTDRAGQADDNRPRAEIAQAFGTSAVLQGRVMNEQDHVRVTLQLYRVSRGVSTVDWTNAYVRPLTSAMALQSAIARDVASQLNIRLTGKDKTRLARRQANVNPGAYEAFLAGRADFFWGSQESRRQAETSWKKALELDPTFTEPYAHLALLYCHGGGFLVGGSRKARQVARDWAQKAIDAGDGLAEAYAAIAWTSMVDWDWPGADEHFQRALRENSDFGLARVWYALYLAAMGRWADARDQADTAMASAPDEEAIATHAGEAYLQMRDIDKAARIWRDIVRRHPDYWGPHFFLAKAALAGKRPDDAIRELDEAQRLRGHDQETDANTLTLRAVAHAMAGRPADAQRIVDGLEARKEKGEASIGPMVLAEAYVALGYEEKAESWLKRAGENKAEGLYAIRVNPLFTAVHDRPWFRQVIADMVFPPSKEFPSLGTPDRATAK